MIAWFVGMLVLLIGVISLLNRYARLNHRREQSKLASEGRLHGRAMIKNHRSPPEWLDSVPAEVVACFIPGELRIVIHPGCGLADGGVPRDIPLELVPQELQLPNTRLWVQLDDKMKVIRVWKRNT
jgi:hypothetical protein